MAKKKTTESKKPNIEKKKKLISKKKKLKQTLALLSSDSDSDTDSSLEKLQTLLEPYPKEHLIDLLATAAAADSALAARITAAAERDVSHRKIFVHGLGWDATKETLMNAFGGYGEIEDCNVILDRVTGKSKGYGFVLFASRKGAEKALKEPNKKIRNRMASCQLSSVGPVGGAAPAASAQQEGTGRKIYISNVPADADPEKLRTFFAKFGELENGPSGFDSQTGKSRGFAFFSYKTMESAKAALQEQYKMFDGHQLRCQKATENKNKAAIAGGAATITTAVQPMQQPVMAAAMAAAQNMAMMSQQYQYPGLNQLYGGLITNPVMAAQLAGYGSIELGQLAGYGSTGPSQLGGYGSTGQNQAAKLGGGLGSSVLGAFGASGSGQFPGASARAPGTAGNLSFKR